MKNLRPIRRVVFLCCAAVIAALPQSPAQAQVIFDWVRNGASSWQQQGYAVAVAPDGSVAAAGTFYYYVDLGQTNFYAYANNSHHDALLARYSPDGTLLWARRDGGHGYETAHAAAFDAAGNLYVCGQFSSTAYFGTTNLSGFGSDDVYLAKYSTNGEVLWVASAGGGGSDVANALAVDAQGNAVIAGSFANNIAFGSTNLTAAAGTDAFMAKYSPSGDCLWATRLGGNSSEIAYAVAAGQGGEYYVAGEFGGTLEYSDRCLFSAGSGDAFVARINGDGEVDGARGGGGPSVDRATAIAVSPSEEVIVSGYFYGSAGFSGTNVTAAGGNDIFIAGYDPEGDLTTVRSYGGTGDEWLTGLAVDTQGNSYLSGYFNSSPLTFPGTNLFTMGSYDIFLARFDNTGSFKWATRAGAGNPDYGHAVAADATGGIYVAGQFYTGAGFGGTNIYTPGGSGFYVAKYHRELPVIVTPPLSQILTEASTLALSITATGSAPFAYQWERGGVPLAGATNATYTVPAVVIAQAGDYGVRVSNVEGAVFSPRATVQVWSFGGAVETTGLAWHSGGDVPWFSQTNVSYDGVDSLRSGIITNNQQSWLETAVAGPARVSFRWKISSENGYDFLLFHINGAEATNTSGKVEWKLLSFLLPAGTNTLRWVYVKDESESVGQDAGWLDDVLVEYAPAFTTVAVSQIVTSGVTVTFSAAATGTGPFTWQWQHNGTNLAGATNSVLQIPGVLPSQAGAYRVTVSNNAGALTSADATLTVLVPPTITMQPQDQTVSAGATVTLTAAASGQGPFLYQWFRNGVSLGNPTNQPMLTLTSVQPGDAGAYSLLVISPSGNTFSQADWLTILGLVMRPSVDIDGVIGGSYRLDYKNNASATNWTVLTNVTLNVTPYHHVDFSAEGHPRRFYRVVRQ